MEYDDLERYYRQMKKDAPDHYRKVMRQEQMEYFSLIFLFFSFIYLTLGRYFFRGAALLLRSLFHGLSVSARTFLSDDWLKGKDLTRL